ncbi:hypothetical protein Tco_1475120 [Tanacetum coccineum]
MFVYVPELSTGHPLSHRSISRNSTPKASDDTLRKRHMMVKRRHGKCAAPQLVLFLKAKSDTLRVGCVSGIILGQKAGVSSSHRSRKLLQQIGAIRGT